MAAPFKRPRGLLDPPPAAQITAAAITTTSTTSASTSTSLSHISDDAQRAMLNAMPLVTQPLKLLERFRKPSDRTEDVDWTFRKVFLKSEYKGRQREIMQASLRGADILVIAPTGMGKSLCFQVPAVTEKHGLTLVVTPLLSLMQDQVAALKRLSVPCAMLSSKTPIEVQKEVLSDMQSGHPKNRLLYITPERLGSPTFRKKLQILYKQNELNRLVVDEAHCISEWGHDFRPEYAKLGLFRSDFPKTPITALTASATPKVQDDIVNELALDTDLLFKAVHPFNRVNLYYEVRYFSEREQPPSFRSDDVLSYILKASSRSASSSTSCFSGIIYCRAKKTCDELSEFLRSKGVNAAAYHRGLKDSEADRTQEQWLHADERRKNGQSWVDCVGEWRWAKSSGQYARKADLVSTGSRSVATIAFGMGIDKANCRYVIHYDVPKSFEGYYQETGRAGRDGHTARCIMYYSGEDKARIQSLVSKSHGARVRRNEQGFGAMPSQRAPKSIDALLAYAENVRLCRHLAICRYFGEKVTEVDAATYCNRLCDVCRDSAKTRRRRDEGLVSLDFAATQAVTADVSRVSPDDFYADGQDPIEAHEQERDDVESVEEDEMDSGDAADPPRKCREGFRTAAIQLERDSAKSDDVPRDPSSSPPSGTIANVELELREEQGHEEEQNAGIHVDRSGMGLRQETPSITLVENEDDINLIQDRNLVADLFIPSPPARRISSTFADRPASPQRIASSSKRAPQLGGKDRREDDEESLPTPIGQTKKTVDALRAPLIERRDIATAPVSASIAPKSAISVASGANGAYPVRGAREGHKLPQVGIVSKPPRFVPPLNDATRYVKYEAAVHVARHGEAASSVGDDPPKDFDVDPSIYEKKLPMSIRKEAVVHLYKQLQRALFSKYGLRSSESEEVVWKELEAGSTTHDQRRDIILLAAISLESDLFWISLTAEGYRRFLGPRTRAIESLVTGHDALLMTGHNRVSHDVISTLRRIASAVLPKKRIQKRKVLDSENS